MDIENFLLHTGPVYKNVQFAFQFKVDQLEKCVSDYLSQLKKSLRDGIKKLKEQVKAVNLKYKNLNETKDWFEAKLKDLETLKNLEPNGVSLRKLSGALANFDTKIPAQHRQIFKDHCDQLSADLGSNPEAAQNIRFRRMAELRNEDVAASVMKNIVDCIEADSIAVVNKIRSQYLNHA